VSAGLGGDHDRFRCGVRTRLVCVDGIERTLDALATYQCEAFATSRCCQPAAEFLWIPDCCGVLEEAKPGVLYCVRRIRGIESVDPTDARTAPWYRPMISSHAVLSPVRAAPRRAALVAAEIGSSRACIAMLRSRGRFQPVLCPGSRWPVPPKPSGISSVEGRPRGADSSVLVGGAAGYQENHVGVGQVRKLASAPMARNRSGKPSPRTRCGRPQNQRGHHLVREARPGGVSRARRGDAVS
jgi:hypothetical protein